MKKQIYEWLFVRIMGWKITGRFDPEIKQSVIMVLPHTSWHDFYLGLFTRGIVGLEMNWVGKKELFKFPFGWYFRWMGGEPLDRSGGLNKVDSIAEIFRKREIFRMAIAPEGTRKKTADIKTGFYYIALKAKVPVIAVAFDFSKKEIKIRDAFHPTGNIESDLKILLQHFKGVKGKIPENGFETENISFS